MNKLSPYHRMQVNIGRLMAMLPPGLLTDIVLNEINEDTEALYKRAEALKLLTGHNYGVKPEAVEKLLQISESEDET